MKIPGVGLTRGVAMSEYHELDALGSTHLGWLAVSPLYYRHMRSQPPEETDALALGTAVHTAALEPELFDLAYVLEPDPETVAPGAAKPRATKAYRSAVEALEESGRKVLRGDTMEQIRLMAISVRTHPHAAKLLERAPEREVTVLWYEYGRRCRARADLLGDGLLADLKTTRDLSRFNPWAISDLGYYRQAAWYQRGLAAHGKTIKHSFLVAVESSPPYDVGVFVLDPTAIEFGHAECEHLLRVLAECEETKNWPGMYPDVVSGQISPALAERLTELEAG